MVGWVGVGGVRVVGWRVVNELRNEELLVGGVLSEINVVCFALIFHVPVLAWNLLCTAVPVPVLIP